MSNNLTSATPRGLTIERALAELDSLPSRVRLRLQYAPVFLDPAGILKLVRYGFAEDEILDLVEQMLPKIAGKLTLETYGPDHPTSAKPEPDLKHSAASARQSGEVVDIRTLRKRG